MTNPELEAGSSLRVVHDADAPRNPVLSAEAAGGGPSQAEMPFALVAGEPVTQLPQDLYIPPFALEVFLEAFEGPLDLLLYLIRRQNLDILNIPIAEISQIPPFLSFKNKFLECPPGSCALISAPSSTVNTGRWACVVWAMPKRSKRANRASRVARGAGALSGGAVISAYKSQR